MNKKEIKMSLLTLLTSYRIPAAIVEASRGEGIAKKLAVRGLRDIIRSICKTELTSAETEQLCSELAGSADYAINDFHVYWEKLCDSDPWTKSYYEKLSEEFSTEFLKKALGATKDSTILDVGCGQCVGARLFESTQCTKTKVSYLGMDKRLDKYLDCAWTPILKELRLKFKEADLYKGDLFDLENVIGEDVRNKVDTVLMCNFMHVFDITTYSNILDKLRKNLKNLHEILVVEPDPESFLSPLFDYHMYKHCGGRAFQPEKFLPDFTTVAIGELHLLHQFVL